jgi:hypothetical protein
MTHVRSPQVPRPLAEAAPDFAHRPAQWRRADVGEVVRGAISGPGESLDHEARARLEPRLSYDFSRVRVHADGQAARAAKRLGAQAFSAGPHLVFAPGQYAPRDPGKDHLLAHELVHTAQHPVASVSSRVAGPRDPREAEAESVARTVAAGRNLDRPLEQEALEPALLLRRDTRLDRFLGEIPQVASRTSGQSDESRVAAILTCLSGVDLRDRDNLGPIADAVARAFPEATLFAFLAHVERDVSVSRIAPDEQRMRQVERMLAVQPRGPYGTYGPFPTMEIVSGTVATQMQRTGTAGVALFEGVIEGMGGPGSDELIARLNERLRASLILNVVAPEVFAAGAVVGIAEDFWHLIRGLYDLITDFPGMLRKFAELYSQIVSPAGAAFSRIMGRHIGMEWKDQLWAMSGYNVFRFTYEVGRLIGPTVVYAVLALLGVTAEMLIAPIARRFLELFRRWPGVLRMAEAIGGHLPHRRLPSPIAAATEAEIDAAVQALEVERVTGPASRPRIGDRPVPTRRRQRLDVGTLPVHGGETVRAAVVRVRRVIGRRLSEIPELNAAWLRARSRVLSDRTLSAANHSDLYRLTGRRFWQEVRADPGALRHFTEAGFSMPPGPTTAPVLSGVAADIPITETRISLDHIHEKAIGENWRLALDPDNLQMEFAMPNTAREILQTRHPSLRSE